MSDQGLRWKTRGCGRNTQYQQVRVLGYIMDKTNSAKLHPKTQPNSGLLKHSPVLSSKNSLLREGPRPSVLYRVLFRSVTLRRLRLTLTVDPYGSSSGSGFFYSPRLVCRVKVSSWERSYDGRRGDPEGTGERTEIFVYTVD